MTQKTKATFNLGDKKVYKYNFLILPSVSITDYMTILSPLKFSGPGIDTTVGAVIDEYYVATEVIDSKRRRHLVQFTIN